MVDYCLVEFITRCKTNVTAKLTENVIDVTVLFGYGKIKFVLTVRMARYNMRFDATTIALPVHVFP